MRSRLRLLRISALFCWQLLWLAPITRAAAVSSFDDIQFWVGSGDNQAALLVDWDGGSSADESLAWGFRWPVSEVATGADMLAAVISADSRLFAKLNLPIGSSTILFALGYDLSNDGAFGTSDNTAFDVDGVALSGPPDPPPFYTAASSSDSADHYEEGWFSSFWQYGNSSDLTSPYDGGSWTIDEDGMADRSLTNGDWDSWAFSIIPLNSNGIPDHRLITETAFAENPVAATPTDILGDYNGNGTVDSADYTVWLSTLGEQVVSVGDGADGNFNGTIDEGDYGVWKQNFGVTQSNVASINASDEIPEPASLIFGLQLGLAFLLIRNRST